MRRPALLGSYWTLAVGADIAHGSQRHCPHDFRSRVEAAARAGYTGMGFWHDDLRRHARHVRLRAGVRDRFRELQRQPRRRL